SIPNWRSMRGRSPTRSTTANARYCAWPATACPPATSPRCSTFPPAPCATTSAKPSASSAPATASRPSASPARKAGCDQRSVEPTHGRLLLRQTAADHGSALQEPVLQHRPGRAQALRLAAARAAGAVVVVPGVDVQVRPRLALGDEA